jgi:hypothetical protein
LRREIRLDRMRRRNRIKKKTVMKKSTFHEYFSGDEDLKMD